VHRKAGPHLYTSNRLELLADALAQMVRSPLRDPFAAEAIVIPTLGLERWLTQQLAVRQKICANAILPFSASIRCRTNGQSVARPSRRSLLLTRKSHLAHHELASTFAGRPSLLSCNATLNNPAQSCDASSSRARLRALSISISLFDRDDSRLGTRRGKRLAGDSFGGK
jgi:exonuclease V gamma subunit